MGQKTHPKGFRLGISATWDSKWYAKPEQYAKSLHEDIKIREYLKGKLYNAGIAKIEIERASDRVTVNVHTARPGLVIGKKGAGIDSMRLDLARFTKDEVNINMKEVRRAELDAQLVAAEEVVVEEGGRQVVGGTDGVDVTGQVKIELLHRNDLRAAAPGTASAYTYATAAWAPTCWAPTAWSTPSGRAPSSWPPAATAPG